MRAVSEVGKSGTMNRKNLYVSKVFVGLRARIIEPNYERALKARLRFPM